MTTRISPEDWEILSAYLDGQASVKEQEKLKQKLATEPDMQRALEELQRTKMVLRSAPRRRVPHNFTLTPSMVPQRKPLFRLVPSLSFASGLAVLLLVLTFAFSGLTGLARPGSLAAQAPESTAAAQVGRSNQAAPQTDLTQPGANNPPIINWGGGGFGGAGGGAGGGSDTGATGLGGGAGGAAESTAVPPEGVPPGKGGATGITPTPENGGFGGPPPTPPVGGNEPGKPTLTPEGTPQTSIASLPTETAIVPTAAPVPNQPPAVPSNLAPGEGPILGIRPTQQMGKIVVDQGADQFTAVPTATQAPPASFVSQHLVPIQVGLGVLALLMALAAFLIHRRS